MSGEVSTVRDKAGHTYELRRIQIEELPEYRARHGLQPIERVTLGDGDDWPPMVLYGPVAELGRGEGNNPECDGSNPSRPSEEDRDE